jgi:signal transduction histidine kinase
VSIPQILHEIDAAWHGRFALVGRRLTIADAPDAPDVRGNSIMLRHALDVLLDNALNHGEGEVHIGQHVGTDTVTITVADEGPGFSEAPPQSETDASADSGLGLPLAQRLIEALPGRLVLHRTSLHPQIDIVLQRATSTEA